MTSTCTCGNTNVTISKKPPFIFDCNCSLCRKSGSAWGYFTSAEVVVEGKTTTYKRNDKDNPFVEIHSCEVCAATTHFELTEEFKLKNPHIDQVGVNMKLFDPSDLDGIDLQYPNGKDWTGEGPFDFRRGSVVIGDNFSW